VATALEATDAGDEFLAELDQVEEDSGKKPRRELNHWWNHKDHHKKRPTKRPTKKPRKKHYYPSGHWGW
jgi:hypothetical protein